jgi:hypothetical protein
VTFSAARYSRDALRRRFQALKNLDSAVVFGRPNQAAPRLLIRKTHDECQCDIQAQGILVIQTADGHRARF